jgi:hypothetical protein
MWDAAKAEATRRVGRRRTLQLDERDCRTDDGGAGAIEHSA